MTGKKDCYFLIILFGQLLGRYIFASEISVIQSVSNGAYVLSQRNTWEHVYENEKLTSGFRIKTEVGASVSIVINDVLNVILYENSLFELNENFSDKSNVISCALFYGSSEFWTSTSDKKIRINTPFKIISITGGKIRISVDEGNNTKFEVLSGRIKDVVDLNEVNPPNNVNKASFYVEMIDNYMKKLKSYYKMYEELSLTFEGLIENRLNTRQKTTPLVKEIERKFTEIMNTVLMMNEAKNRINMFAISLRKVVDAKNETNNDSNSDISDVSNILEELKMKQEEIITLKGKYNNIISSEVISIIKTYENLKNNRKRK
ncbi:MAG: FecR domain-containing protein [Deltaproteobacteria bacterium]|nr:FecR domain-containing protein [Deltaproteobacteria bacterium]